MNLEEKMGLMRQLFQMSLADDELKPVEYKFLYEVALSMGVPLEKLEEMIEGETNYKIPKEEEVNIIQIYRLALMMKVDRDTSPEEINFLKSFALQLRQNPIAVDNMLAAMEKSSGGTLSFEKLMTIFKVVDN